MVRDGISIQPEAFLKPRSPDRFYYVSLFQKLKFWNSPMYVKMKRTLDMINARDDKTGLQAEMLGNRLRKRYKHLVKWARRNGIGAYRLYDGDIPEIPLVLDY